MAAECEGDQRTREWVWVGFVEQSMWHEGRVSWGGRERMRWRVWLEVLGWMMLDWVCSE